MSLREDDAGIAYGIVTVIAFVLVMAALYLFFMPVWNGIFAAVNGLIDDGTVTKRGRDSMVYLKFMFTFGILIVGVIGALLWGWIRAIDKRETGT